MTPTFWTWAADHWWLAFWLIFWAMAFSAQVISNVFFRLPNRLIRGASIRKRGWPPKHLDADGDFKKPDA